MRGISSNLTNVVDETTVRGQAMTNLIKQYLTIPANYGLMNIGDMPNVVFPILFVEPSPGYSPSLVMMGKYEIELTYFIYWYVTDTNQQDIVSFCSSIGHNLEKLFSNNALNDLGTSSPPTHKFCQYDPYWREVSSFSFRCLPTFRNPLPKPTADWMRLGKGTVKIKDWIIR